MSRDTYLIVGTQVNGAVTMLFLYDTILKVHILSISWYCVIKILKAAVWKMLCIKKKKREKKN